MGHLAHEVLLPLDDEDLRRASHGEGCRVVEPGRLCRAVSDALFAVAGQSDHAAGSWSPGEPAEVWIANPATVSRGRPSPWGAGPLDGAALIPAQGRIDGVVQGPATRASESEQDQTGVEPAKRRRAH